MTEITKETIEEIRKSMKSYAWGPVEMAFQKKGNGYYIDCIAVDRGLELMFEQGFKAGQEAERKELTQKINEKLYELRDMDSDYRDGQRSVFEWMVRKLRD